MQWVEFKKGDLTQNHFEFGCQGREYVLQDATSADTGVGVGGKPKLTKAHSKVVDVAGGEVIALYVSEDYGKEKAMLSFEVGLDEELELLCALSMVSWRDKIQEREGRGAPDVGGGPVKWNGAQ